MAEEAGSFTVNGKQYSLPTTITVGEMVDAENFFGVNFAPGGKRGMAMAAAMMYIAIRREDATVTVDDVRSLPAEVFATVVEAGEASPPDVDNSAKPPSSGDPSATTSDTTAPSPDTGSPGSDTGSDSAPLTLAS